MTREERLLRDLCLEIALDRIGGERFNHLLIEAGLILDEAEWDLANRLIGRSESLSKIVEEVHPPC